MLPLFHTRPSTRADLEVFPDGVVHVVAELVEGPGPGGDVSCAVDVPALAAGGPDRLRQALPDAPVEGVGGFRFGGHGGDAVLADPVDQLLDVAELGLRRQQP